MKPATAVPSIEARRAEWSTWTSRIDPPRRQVVAIVPGIAAAPGRLIVSADDRYSGDIGRTAALIAAAPELKNGCAALLGLLQLICARDDVPAAIRHILMDSYRVDEARAAIAKAEGE